MICLILFEKFSDALPAFTCARPIGNIRNICLEVSLLSLYISSLYHMQLYVPF